MRLKLSRMESEIVAHAMRIGINAMLEVADNAKGQAKFELEHKAVNAQTVLDSIIKQMDGGK